MATSTRATEFKQIVTSGDMSSNITSEVIDLKYRTLLAIQVTYTGTPTGTFKVEGSVDGDNFYELNLANSLANPAGSASGDIIELANVAVLKLRLVYTAGSGSGSLNAFTLIKGS